MLRRFVSRQLQGSQSQCAIRRVVAIPEFAASSANAPLHNELSGTSQSEASNPMQSDYARDMQNVGTVADPMYNFKTLRLDFDNPKLALAHKTNSELIRAWAVFTICGIPPLVSNAGSLINTSRKVFGDKLTFSLVKQTFFGHFCGGENQEDIKQKIASLKSSGVGAILDYAAESDVDLAPRPKVLAARTYDYESEAECDANMDITLRSIRSAAQGDKQGFAAVKMTSLGKPELLVHISTIIHQIRRLFRQFEGGEEQQRDELYYFKHEISLAQFTKGILRMGVKMSESEIQALFRFIDADSSGSISYLEWVEALRPGIDQTSPFFQLGAQFQGTQWLPALSDTDYKRMQNMLNRLDSLAVEAAKYKVTLMVDAEHTYFQPAIDHSVQLLQKKFNKEYPVIFNTFQCYLTDTNSRVMLDLERCRRGNYFFGAKLVRGAYMVQESQRASKHGYKNPILPTIEDTHRNYDGIIDTLMDRAKEGQKLAFMVASHNENSIRHTARKMAEYNVAKDSNVVFFGQLLGMCDNVSFTLGDMGYAVYKYVPYGPIGEVMPYLIRRGEENSDVLSSSRKERSMIGKELLRRFMGA